MRLEDMVVAAAPTDTYVRANDEATEKLSAYYAALKKEIEYILHLRRPASTKSRAGDLHTTGADAFPGDGISSREKTEELGGPTNEAGAVSKAGGGSHASSIMSTSTSVDAG